MSTTSGMSGHCAAGCAKSCCQLAMQHAAVTMLAQAVCCEVLLGLLERFTSHIMPAQSMCLLPWQSAGLHAAACPALV